MPCAPLSMLGGQQVSMMTKIILQFEFTIFIKSTRNVTGQIIIYLSAAQKNVFSLILAKDFYEIVAETNAHEEYLPKKKSDTNYIS